LPVARDGNRGLAGEGELSITAWMELFYASLLDHDPATLAQRLEMVRLHGRSRRLHRAASHSEREMLRAALRAIDELENDPRNRRDHYLPRNRGKAA